MSTTENTIRAEGLKEDFYQELFSKNWNACRATLSSMEEMLLDTYELRRVMNQAMDEANAEDGPDDFTHASGIEN